MKKILAIVLVFLLSLTIFVACQDPNDNNDPTSYTLVAPDGAPALAVSKLMAENMQFGNKFDYKVIKVDNDTTQLKKQFVGNDKHADFGLLPINLASLLLSEGTEYKMIGVVTHGNLYFLSKNFTTQLTVQNAVENLKGKRIGVVNLPAVPGLTTKALLSKMGLSFVTESEQLTSENVYLQGIGGGDIAQAINQGTVDYVVAPEPAVSTITTNAPIIKKVGALHDLYGRYPQAVLVVKTEVWQSNKQLVKDLFQAMVGASDYVKANTQKAVEAVQNHLPEGTSPSFTAEKTTASSVDGCSINLQSMTSEQIANVNSYIADILAVGGSAKIIPQTFYLNIFAQ